MKPFTWVRQFISLEPAVKLLFLEAYFYLGWARLLLLRPFHKVAPTLGEYMQETTYDLSPSYKKTIGNVQQAVQVMSRYTCWKSKCLVRAIAAMKMLQRREIESTLYLGTGKNQQAELAAHAWLRSGPIYVTGADVMNQYTIVGIFAQLITRPEANSSDIK